MDFYLYLSTRKIFLNFIRYLTQVLLLFLRFKHAFTLKLSLMEKLSRQRLQELLTVSTNLIKREMKEDTNYI